MAEEPTFRVTFVKSIWNRSKRYVEEWRQGVKGHGPGKSPSPEYAAFKRHVSLPFAPTVGLDVWQAGWRSGPVTELRWFADQNCFECWVEETYSSSDDTADVSNYDELVADALAHGWGQYI